MKDSSSLGARPGHRTRHSRGVSPCTTLTRRHLVHDVKLEGAQRVHISAKYTIMLWCRPTRLHVNISTSLCTCAVDASPANDNEVIDNDGCGVAGVSGIINLEWCWHFCTFFHNPYFDFEPDYVIRKPRKRGFQRYIVRTEIFSTFHARVEYISVKQLSGK